MRSSTFERGGRSGLAHEEKCLVGLHVASPNHAGAYVHLRLSRKGRAIYQRLRAAFPSIEGE
jgi:hypothetical protein